MTGNGRKDTLMDKNMEEETKRILIIGAGEVGSSFVEELHRKPDVHMQVLCVIDDDPKKIGKDIEGVPIVGNRYDIPEAVKLYRIDDIIFAIPSVYGADRQEILNICRGCNCRLQTVPTLCELINNSVNINQICNVKMQDLLGRKQLQINNEEVLESIKGKKILVTGGGGSIGGELCRQIAAYEPEQLVIFDIYENNAYEIQQELIENYPRLNLEVLIGSVRNTNRVNGIMKKYRPEIVFHAAAHKHVPLMEESPNEAIKNNVMGTYKTAVAAARFGVKKFVLISTDKAVNPTNIMGASKRICEMIIQMMNRQFKETDFVAVRFGNVLGSNGSMVPTFKKQIEHGGPVKVTDKNIIRYFMTIPEAVSLVLQASYYAEGGEIYVLDMGEPVRIDDMARNLIRMSGFISDVDIKIEYTGLRPGEKIFEELLMAEEGLKSTKNELIHIGCPIKMDDDWFRKKLIQLDEASYQESEEIKKMVAEIVPTYHYKEEKVSVAAVSA